MAAVSELCTKCGLCCVMLSARCRREEAISIVNWASETGLLTKQSDLLADDQDPVLMKFPCTFLRGRPTRGVRCAVYDGPRPKLCSSYLCKAAVQFKMGEISFEEARQRIMVAFWSNDASLFNWHGVEGEASLAARASIRELVETLRSQGFSDLEADFLVSSSVSSLYVPMSSMAHSLFSLHFFTFDARRDSYKDPTGVYIDDEKMEILRSISPEADQIVRVVIENVLAELRQYLCPISREVPAQYIQRETVASILHAVWGNWFDELAKINKDSEEWRKLSHQACLPYEALTEEQKDRNRELVDIIHAAAFSK